MTKIAAGRSSGGNLSGRILISLTAALFLTTVSLFAQTDSEPAQLIAYYPMSSNTQDSVPNGSNGIVIGHAKFEDGALVLDGDSYVNFGSAFAVDGSFSLSLWACPATNDRLMRVLGRFENTHGNKDYCLFLNCGGRLWTFFSDNGSSDEGHALLTTTLLPACLAGEWRHLAVTWDVSNGPAGLTLYSDGVPLSTTNVQLSDVRYLNLGEADLTLGAYDVGETLANPFQGSLAQLILFKGVLTDAEVRDIRGQGRTGNLLPYLSAYLPDARSSSQPNIQPRTMNLEPRTKNDEPPNPEPSSSHVIYVDAQLGNDEFNGAHASVVNRSEKHGPKRTINGALRAAQDGDTVYVASGEYRESVRNAKVRMIATGHVVVK